MSHREEDFQLVCAQHICRMDIPFAFNFCEVEACMLEKAVISDVWEDSSWPSREAIAKERRGDEEKREKLVVDDGSVVLHLRLCFIILLHK